MAGALALLKCNVIQSTSDEAPGHLADVESHVGGHHSPDLFQVQHELSRAVAASMAAKQHATAKAVMMAEEQRTYVQEPRSMTACTLGSEVSATLPR